MGRRGPARTPTELLKLQGSWRADKRDAKEPKAPKGTPETLLIDLTKTERDVFDQTCRILESMGVLNKTDGTAISRYAKAVVRYNKVSAFCEKRGETYPQYVTDREGNKTIKGIKRFPESYIRNELENTLLRLEREFGLTPSSRAGIEVQEQKPTTDLELKYFGAS
jgi:P27 family predicted phage terminase small subunit